MAWQISSIVFTRLALLLLLFSGCSSKQTESVNTQSNRSGEAIKIVLDSADDDRLIGFYFGSYLLPGENLSDIVEFKNGSWWMLEPTNSSGDAHLAALYAAAGSDTELDWDELEAQVIASYYQVRQAPLHVDELANQIGDWKSEDWFSHELNGQMTTYKRRLSIRKESLLAAIDKMDALSSDVIYAVGTAIVGEHLENDVVVETTAMIKRSDNYWDYFAYGPDGQLAGKVKKEPEDLTVPTKCVGCHFGDRLFEPERSFPSESRPGPNGKRSLYVSEDYKNPTISKTISEHAKRSDHVLGLYATLFLSDLNARVRKNMATTRELEIAEKLGISRISN